MEQFLGYTELKNAGTYDHMRVGNIVGSIRDPYVVTTESGMNMAPSSIVYLQTPDGSMHSSVMSGLYKKVLYEYSMAKDYLQDKTVNNYIVIDEDADAAVLALPIPDNESIYRADESLNRLLDQNTPESSVVARFIRRFPGFKFGVLGSQALFSQQSSSDIDLFVQGCRDFAVFQKLLQREELQKELGLEPITQREMEFNATRFAKKHDVPIERARQISELRCRYKIKTKGDTRNISFAAALDSSEMKNMGILGTKKIAKVEEDGVVVDADFSTGFPRMYQVEIGGISIDVVSMHWSLRSLVRSEEKVHVKGTLRENSVGEFISLEDKEDRLLAQ